MYIRVCDYILSDSCICVQESLNCLVVTVLYLCHTNPGSILSFALFFHFLRKNEKLNETTWQLRALWLVDFPILRSQPIWGLYSPFITYIYIYIYICSFDKYSFMIQHFWLSKYYLLLFFSKYYLLFIQHWCLKLYYIYVCNK